MLGRLRELGLAEGVGLAHVTLGDFLTRIFATMTVEPGTRLFYGHTRKNTGKVKASESCPCSRSFEST